MSLIDRITNAKEPGVIINVLVDTNKYLATLHRDNLDVLSIIARLVPSFSPLLSSSEMKYLYDLFVPTSSTTVDRCVDVLIALSDSLTTIDTGSDSAPLIDLLSRYAGSPAITTVLMTSIDRIDDEQVRSRLIEYATLLCKLPDTISTVSLGSRSAHACSRRLASTCLRGLAVGLDESWKRLHEGHEGERDLRVLSTLLTKGRNMRISDKDNLLRSTVIYLSSRPPSPLWDELSQALIVRGECSVLEEEQLIGEVIEQISQVEEYKRFFGHWLKRNSNLHRACTVRFVLQRSLNAQRTRALVEYIDWASGMDILKEVSNKIVRVFCTKNGSRAQLHDARHRVRVLAECGRRMRLRDRTACALFWSDLHPTVITGTRLHLESTEVDVRELGMVVAELVALWMDTSSTLSFDYSQGDGFVREVLKRGKGEDDEECKTSTSSIEEDKKLVDTVELLKIERDSDDDEDEQEYDSDDTDDELYRSHLPESELHFDPAEISKDHESSSKVHPPPSYLRDALEWVATEKEKYEKFEAGLKAIEVLFRKKAVGWNELGVSALKTLSFLDNRFAVADFNMIVHRSMVAIVVGQATQLAPMLAGLLYERNTPMRQRYAILAVLLGAARELAGVDKPEQGTKERERVPSMSNQTQQPEWLRVVTERVLAKSRRFSQRTTTTPAKAVTENRFVRVADKFILPLLQTKLGDHLDITGRDVPLLVRVIFCVSELLIMAEHAPTVVRMSLSLTSVIESLRYHELSSVREAVVAGYLAVCTVLPEDVLAMECKPWLQYVMDRSKDSEESDRCRKLSEDTARIALTRLDVDEEMQ